MSKMNVTVTNLTSGADTLEQLNTQFKNAVSQLESLEGTLSSMWEGEANTSFRTAFNNDKAQMTEFYNVITRYVATLRQIANRYNQTEAQNTEIASRRTY